MVRSASGADSLSAPVIPTRIGYFLEEEYSSGKIRFHSIDTLLGTARKINKPLDQHYNYLGANGSVGESKVFTPSSEVLTYTGLRSFDLYTTKSNEVRYFQTNKRYSEVDWHTGAFKEQAIRFLHSQNILKGWNAGIDFKRLGVKDFTSFSRTFQSDFLLFTSYRSTNGKYALFANVGWLYMNNLANGGLPDDSLFLNGNVSNLDLKGLGYSIAGASQRFRYRKMYLSQYYSLKNKKDSLSPGIRLNHSISFDRYSYAYVDADPDSSFYTDFFYGSVTKDTLHAASMTNRFSVSLPAGQRKFLPNWNTEYFIRHQAVRYGQVTDTTWNNLSVGGLLRLLSDSTFSLHLSGEGVINGYDKGNILLSAKLFLPLKKLGQLTAGIISGRSSADQRFRLLETNNFYWKNNFKSINFLTIHAGYVLEKARFGIEFRQHVIDNWVYMNPYARPEQLSYVLTVSVVTGYKNFTLKKLHFDNTVTWQRSSVDALRLPSLVSSHALYVETFFFKKALLANLGFSCDFNSSYYANAFIPSSALFYLQNEIKTGGFARIDLFFNMKIKTARIFLMMENVADNLTGNSYYLTPHYPMAGRVFKFGVSWRFFD